MCKTTTRKTIHGLAALCLLAATQTNAAAIKPAHTQPLIPGESQALIIEKAANVLPSARQMAYHRREYTAFIVFGPNTYTGKEWGDGKEDPRIFNPTDLDTDQWCRVMQEAGMKSAVLVVKHHDGFVLWQSRYTRHGVVSSPWEDGQGDVLRSLVDSCRPLGIKLGVYLSPADLYQMEAADGLYGNGSSYRDRVIPRPVAGRPFADKRSFTVNADDYNEYFLNQLFELLTEYGPMHEVWFDGAHPKKKGGQKYIRDQWYRLIRELAPEAVIFGGPDVRWVGNEAGVTRPTEWSVIPSRTGHIDIDRPEADLGSRARLFNPSFTVYGKHYVADHLRYIIAETDTSIRHGWYWRDDTHQQVRSADDVFDIYERAVGGNAHLILNIPPNREGRFSPRDVAAAVGAGKRIRATYASDLLAGANAPAAVLDGDSDSFWQTSDSNRSIEIDLPRSITLNRFVLQEAIASHSQRIEKHALDIWVRGRWPWSKGRWQTVAEGTSVGYKKILRFPAVTTDKLRLRIPASRLQASVSGVSAHYSPPSPPRLQIGKNERRQVLISERKHRFDWKHHSDWKPEPGRAQSETRIHYTTDGSKPTIESPQYRGPFAFESGLVKARAFVDDKGGEIAEIHFGIDKADWTLASVSSEEAGLSAQQAFDGNTGTFWQSLEGERHPHSLAIDLGAPYALNALTYLPRQDSRSAGGMVEKGRIETSPDGQQWMRAEDFEFGNIINDPRQRTHYFKKPVRARYIRFVTTAGAAEQTAAGAAEIGFLGRPL